MAYDVSAIPAYTKQDANKLIYANIFSTADTMPYLTIQTGIKSAETINIIDTEGIWKDQACSFSATGTTTMTQQTITVGKPSVQMSWCEKTLEPKFYQEKMIAGGTYESLTYNTQIIDLTLKKIAKRMETAIWQGNLLSTSQYLKYADGIVRLVAAAVTAGTIVAASNSYAGTVWSEANARVVVKQLASQIVANTDVYAAGAGTIKMFMNHQMYQQYRWKMIADNMFDGSLSGSDNKLFAEGTNIEIVAVNGLAGLNYIYAFEKENMYFGTDMENEQEKYDLWFSQDNREIRLNLEWKYGINFAFPGRVFYYLGV